MKSTQEQLDKMRQEVIDDSKKYNITITKFTCDDCDARFECDFAFDTYNTDGDCLASK